MCQVENKYIRCNYENVTFSDGLLLLYGLCGNVLKNIEKDFKHIDCSIVLLRDFEGNPVDDCICATLGDDQTFMEVIKNVRGKRAFMLTPMWAANWEKNGRS